MRLRLRALLLSCGVVVAADARAVSRYAPAVLAPAPVEILLLGPDAVRIRLAEGRTLPCDSADNHPIAVGRYAGGQALRTSTTRECVCLQQTYAPFIDVDWSNGVVACRPIPCGYRRGTPCVGPQDPTIRLSVSSRRPD